MRFNIKCSQRLDDGDLALVEDYIGVSEQDAMLIMSQYQARAIKKAYVVSFTITVEIVR